MIFSSRLFFQKTNEQIRLYYLSTCFCLIFGRKWRHQKNILKLTDLYDVTRFFKTLLVFQKNKKCLVKLYRHLSIEMQIHEGFEHIVYTAGVAAFLNTLFRLLPHWTEDIEYNSKFFKHDMFKLKLTVKSRVLMHVTN